jgi:methionyl-tRNA synthetase
MSATLEDFDKLELQIGTVQTVTDHPNADSLYLLDVDLGELDNRQLVAGLKDDYDPEDIEGRQVVVITNLEPAEIRGETSNGMLLAADAERHVSLLRPDKAVPNGTTVR